MKRARSASGAPVGLSRSTDSPLFPENLPSRSRLLPRKTLGQEFPEEPLSEAHDDGSGGVLSVTEEALMVAEQAMQRYADVAGKVWQLHSVSPLWKFSTKQRAMQQHGKALRDVLSAKREDVRCSFRVLDPQDEEHPEEQIVSVTISSLSSTGTSGRAHIAQLLIVSFGGSLNPSMRADGFSDFPLLLSRGAADVIRATTDWLANYFDCRILPLSIPPLDLRRHVSSWAATELEDGEGGAPLELQYALPAETTSSGATAELSSVTVKLEAAEADRVRQGVASVVTARELPEAFMTALSSHFFDLFRLRLEACPLLRGSTHIAKLSGTGQLKILLRRRVLEVLRQLVTGA